MRWGDAHGQLELDSPVAMSSPDLTMLPGKPIIDVTSYHKPELIKSTKANTK